MTILSSTLSAIYDVIVGMFLLTPILYSYYATETDWNVMIKSVRLLLCIANTAPLRDALDIHTSDTPQDDVFWPGDADPDKVGLGYSELPCFVVLTHL